jgi:hypothetical protein
VHYSDWRDLLQGLGRVIQGLEGPITGIRNVYYRDWKSLLQGFACAIQGLEGPITGIGN